MPKRAQKQRERRPKRWKKRSQKIRTRLYQRQTQEWHQDPKRKSKRRLRWISELLNERLKSSTTRLNRAITASWQRRRTLTRRHRLEKSRKRTNRRESKNDLSGHRGCLDCTSSETSTTPTTTGSLSLHSLLNRVVRLTSTVFRQDGTMASELCLGFRHGQGRRQRHDQHSLLRTR